MASDTVAKFEAMFQLDQSVETAAIEAVREYCSKQPDGSAPTLLLYHSRAGIARAVAAAMIEQSKPLRLAAQRVVANWENREHVSDAELDAAMATLRDLLDRKAI